MARKAKDEERRQKYNQTCYRAAFLRYIGQEGGLRIMRPGHIIIDNIAAVLR